MKSYCGFKYVTENQTSIYKYMELTEDNWFGVGKRFDGEDSFLPNEEPDIMTVDVKYHSRQYGRTHWNGRKYWEPAGIYCIKKEDKKELFRLLKIWFPDCEFRYKYY